MALAIRAARMVAPLALAALLLCGGCGPIEYINQVTRKASSQVAAAEAANADKYSPYYYTRAVLFLGRAREEAAYADYQAANRFGRLAYEAAELAREEAIRRAADPSDKTYIDATKAAPLGGGDADDDGMAPLIDEETSGSDGDDGDDEIPAGLGGSR